MFYKKFLQTFAIFHYKTNDIKETPIVKLVYVLQEADFSRFNLFLWLYFPAHHPLHQQKTVWDCFQVYYHGGDTVIIFYLTMWELDRRRRWNLSDITGSPLWSCSSSLLRTRMIQSKYIRGNILELKIIFVLFNISSFIGGVKSNVEFTLVWRA